jgi:long-subunit acyl-CoA synthetase (AMP-forming)
MSEIGELWVRPQDPRLVMRGYHNLPDKTAETLVDGWVHTGDAFRVDARGRFFFADRMKDALRRRGENVTATQKVHRHLLRERGTGPDGWDREAAGIVLRRGSR